MNELYFDHNATTPILPQVSEAMRPYLTERCGNPGSAHMSGLAAKEAVMGARAWVAELLGCTPMEVVFTGCATEANNMALFGMFGLTRGPEAIQGHLVTSAIEHPAVLEPAAVLERLGATVTRVPPGPDGRVDPEAVLAACTAETRLISLMLANNETGVLQPVAEVARRARALGLPVHTDAAQAVGKVRVKAAELDVDLLTVAGHKLYAPKGVGALYVRDGLELAPLTFGGGQEGGRRPGTENVPHLVGLGEACAVASADLEREEARQRALGETLLRGLEELGRPFRVNGADAPRLPNTLSVGFAGYTAGDLLSGLLARDVAVSGGAACHAGETSVSHVLQAMGVPLEVAAGTLRISWGRATGEVEVSAFLDRLGQTFAELEGVPAGQ